MDTILSRRLIKYRRYYYPSPVSHLKTEVATKILPVVWERKAPVCIGCIGKVTFYFNYRTGECTKMFELSHTASHLDQLGMTLVENLKIPCIPS